MGKDLRSTQSIVGFSQERYRLWLQKGHMLRKDSSLATPALEKQSRKDDEARPKR